MKVGIIGTGAIGLGSVALLLSFNHKPILWSPSGKGTHAFKKNKQLIARGKVEGEFSPSVVKSAKELALSNDIIKIAVPAYAHKYVIDAISPFIESRHVIVISSHASFSALYLSKKLAERKVSPLVIAWGTTILSGKKTGDVIKKITIKKIKDYFIKSAFISNRLSPLMEFIGSLAIALSIYVGGVFVLNESMTTGQFMSFLVSLLLAYQPVKALGNLNISIQEGLAGAERIFSLMDTNESLLENTETEKESIKITRGKIQIKNLTFSYDNRNVVENLDLLIPEGKKVAIVGLSGSGKSTIVSLLLRFFTNYKGEILIDDQDISHYSLHSLRNKIGLVTQETMLFNDSIEANIRYGNLHASSTDVENAADDAGVSEFADLLPQKLKTIVGESGVKLSGGQRQRIAIARAILKNAPILLLDEATSSLDNLTEKKIQHSIKKLMKNKTSLIIAHRLSTIEDSDLIYVLDKGKVVDSGTHEELLDKCKLYSQLQLHDDLNYAN